MFGDTVDLLSVFSEGRLTHVIGQLTPDNHSTLRVEMGVLDGTNQEVFLEEVMMSHDQVFQEEVAMRVMVFSEACAGGQLSPICLAGESPWDAAQECR